MTALATSPVSWIGLMASLAAFVRPAHMVAVIRHVEEIALVVFLNCIPVAWPAALVVACMMPRKETW